MILKSRADNAYRSPDICPQADQPTFVVLTARTRTGTVSSARSGRCERRLARVAIPREPAAWIRYVLQYEAEAPARAMLSTIGRLYQYAAIAFADIELTTDTLTTVIWNYVAFRVGERTPHDPDSQRLPLWNPV